MHEFADNAAFSRVSTETLPDEEDGATDRRKAYPTDVLPPSGQDEPDR